LSNISFRDRIDGMVDVFDPKAADNIVATIQFRASGKEPGDCYLYIKKGKCTFHEEVAQSPTATSHSI